MGQVALLGRLDTVVGEAAAVEERRPWAADAGGKLVGMASRNSSVLSLLASFSWALLRLTSARASCSLVGDGRYPSFILLFLFQIAA